MRTTLHGRVPEERPLPPAGTAAPQALPDQRPAFGSARSDAVNLAAKLEKHNKEEGTRALTDGGTYALAERQGYRTSRAPERRSNRKVAGVGESVDIVVLAA